ncbi:MAG: hypothetical protein OXE99_09565, partial [Cellvibrionales bacterium]|nr:hypothetical protein [Cellvibrionales bacterium]
RFYQCKGIKTQDFDDELELKGKVFTDDEQRIGNLFVTMVMHLVIVQVIKQLFRPKQQEEKAYSLVGRHIDEIILKYKLEGVDTHLVENMLKKEAFHPVKYLLTSASLTGNPESSGMDVNKFYGYSARNPFV